MKVLFVCILCACCSTAQSGLPSSVPAELSVARGQILVLRAMGAGDQVYECRDAGGTYTWTLKAPDARLLRTDGKVIGRHFAGPTWEAQDGSRVVGKIAASVPSADPQSIPWLLLNAVEHKGKGKMENVSSIQRLYTKGGIAPKAGCVAGHAGDETRIPYRAEYLFYGTGK